MTEVQQETKSSPLKICGGVPRDKVMSRLDNISDLDITNGDKTIDFVSREFYLKLKKIYNITYKISQDGHSSIYMGNLKLDFSSNFIVPNIQTIKPGLSSLEQEIFSRDFTCNALLLDFNLSTIHDPTELGLKDIKNKLIRTCLDPKITLTSNKNRVIRAIYLAAKLDFNIDPEIINYVHSNPEVVKIATQKSLVEKLNQAFELDPDKSAYYLSQMDLWDHVPITEKMKGYI